MKPDQFERELALVPRVLRPEDLPEPLGAAVRVSAECRRLTEERIRCDRLLDRLPEISAPAGFAEEIIARALAPGGAARRPALRVLRSPLALAAAALLVVALTVGLLFRSEPAEEVNPEMLAQLDLLLDWDLLDEHGEDLDLLASADLADILSDFEEEDGGVPR